MGKEELKQDWSSRRESLQWYEMVFKTQAVQPVLSGPQAFSGIKNSKSMAPRVSAYTSQTFSGPSSSRGVSCRGLCYSVFINDSNCCVIGKQAELIQGYVQSYDFTFSFAIALLGVRNDVPVCHLLCWQIILSSAAFLPSPLGKELRESALAHVLCCYSAPPFLATQVSWRQEDALETGSSCQIWGHTNVRHFLQLPGCSQAAGVTVTAAKCLSVVREAWYLAAPSV